MFPRQRGFSLLEILVAFSVLALSLGVLMQIYGGAARNADLALNQMRALQLAQSLLAGASVVSPLAAGNKSGITEDGLRWELGVAEIDTTPLTGGMSTQGPALPLALCQLTATVSWGGEIGGQVGREIGGDPGRNASRSVRLVTLRARPILAAP